MLKHLRYCVPQFILSQILHLEINVFSDIEPWCSSILELMNVKQHWNNTIAKNDYISHYWKMWLAYWKFHSLTYSCILQYNRITVLNCLKTINQTNKKPTTKPNQPNQPIKQKQTTKPLHFFSVPTMQLLLQCYFWILFFLKKSDCKWLLLFKELFLLCIHLQTHAKSCNSA